MISEWQGHLLSWTGQLNNKKNVTSRSHICHFFHKCTFWAQFFSTWKLVNCVKISQNFSTWQFFSTNIVILWYLWQIWALKYWQSHQWENNEIQYLWQFGMTCKLLPVYFLLELSIYLFYSMKFIYFQSKTIGSLL